MKSEELKKSLERILELCLKTARGLRVVLEEGTRRKPATTGTDPNDGTPDEGEIKDPQA